MSMQYSRHIISVTADILIVVVVYAWRRMIEQPTLHPKSKRRPVTHSCSDYIDDHQGNVTGDKLSNKLSNKLKKMGDNI